MSGGNIETDFALAFYREHKFDYIIGVDNGLRFLCENEIVPTHVVGDFDTADPELVSRYRSLAGVEIRTFDPVKDSTDTEIAIELALELESASIVILGGTGSRLDHVLGNLHSMMLAKKAGTECMLLDSHNRIRIISEETVLKREEQYGSYVSLIPLTSAVDGVDLIGFRYPLKNHTFTVFESAGLGVSNEILEEEGRIRLRSGAFLLIESRD